MKQQANKIDALLKTFHLNDLLREVIDVDEKTDPPSIIYGDENEKSSPKIVPAKENVV